MIKTNKHIEIVSSTKTGLSSMSQKSRDAVFTVLTKHYSRVGITIVNNLSDLEALVARKPDLVFLGMKFVPLNPALGQQDPNKIWLTKYFDEHGITYTGSSQEAHELELNKPQAKQRVLDAELMTSPFRVVKQNQQPIREDTYLTYPLFVKPANRGGGLGVDIRSVVYDFEQLQSKIHSITVDFQSDSLLEEYLPGREFSVAILKDEYLDKFYIMPIELVVQPNEHGARIIGGETKSSNTELVLEVADLTIRSKVNMLAINVFHALGARDYGRIDIRLDENGTPHFLEANLLPSVISGYGSFPKACLLNINLDYEPMILSIVRLALKRRLGVSQNAFDLNAASVPAAPFLKPALEV
jgi:D-alanine-D-alanine ligase